MTQALVCDKGSLPFITSPDTDIMITPTNIKFSKDFRILEPIDDIGSQWKWVAILYSDVI
jgi:hypothetical protein